MDKFRFEQLVVRYEREANDSCYGEDAFGWKLGAFLLTLCEADELQKLLGSLDEQLAEQIFDIYLTNIFADSRRVADGALFVALEGESANTEENIQDALGRGAVAIFSFADKEMSLELLDGADAGKVVPKISFPSLAKRLSAMAALFFNARNSANIFGITGTNGKTSCAWMLANAYSGLEQRSAIIGTLGYGFIDGGGANDGASLEQTGFTTPDALETQRILADFAQRRCDVVAMEVSSHALVQGRVAAVDIKTAIFTNLSHDHLDYHSSMEAYGDVKMQLFKMDSVQYAAVNLDDPFAKVLIANLNPSTTYLTYAIDNDKADVRVLASHYDSSGISASIHTPLGELAIQLNLIGQFNLSNALAVIAGLLVNGQPLAQIESVVRLLSSPPGRAQRITLPNDDLVVKSTKRADEEIIAVVDYAHTPDALENILLALKAHCAGTLWCVFGCGGERDKAKRPLMANIAEANADRVIVTRDNSRCEPVETIFDDISKGFSPGFEVIVEPERAQAISKAVLDAKEGDVVLIAGKGHEQYIEEDGKKIPFSDVNHVGDALRQRMERAA